MNVKGRCRGNGVQLANYLLNTKDNVRAEFVAMHGATSNDPRRALLEMSLTSELSSRTDKGLYHMPLSPRAHEGAAMTREQKLRAVEITAEQMGLQGHKWALFEHEKDDGRMHLHLVFERYDHETGRMWDDEGNYDKHLAAARQMEREFGWQITHENKNNLDTGVKQIITAMYRESEDGAAFVATMGKAGFEVVQGIDRRPYKIVDQYGKVHDLARQIKGVRQGEVSEYLNGIRKTLRTETEASHDRRKEHERDQPTPKISDNGHALSESQGLALAMIERIKNRGKSEKQAANLPTYQFTIKQSLGYSPTPASYNAPMKDLRDLSESQDRTAAMLTHYRRQSPDEPQPAHNPPTPAANDNRPQIDQAEIERLKAEQRQIRQRDRTRGGYRR